MPFAIAVGAVCHVALRLPSVVLEIVLGIDNIIFLTILPNCLGPLIVQTTLAVAFSILEAAAQHVGSGGAITAEEEALAAVPARTVVSRPLASRERRSSARSGRRAQNQ